MHPGGDPLNLARWPPRDAGQQHVRAAPLRQTRWPNPQRFILLALAHEQVDRQGLGYIRVETEMKEIHGARVVAELRECDGTGPQPGRLRVRIKDQSPLAVAGGFRQQTRVPERVAQREMRVDAVW